MRIANEPSTVAPSAADDNRTDRKRKSKKRKTLCRSLNPFIHYYCKLRDTLDKDLTTRMIAKIAAYRWETMSHTAKMPYINAAKRHWLRHKSQWRKNAALSRNI